MESKTKNKKARETIEKMVGRSFPGVELAPDEDAIVELKEGWFNAAYQIRLEDGREIILKIAPPNGAEILTYESNIMRTEVDMLRLVKQRTKIPVPEIYYYDDQKDICDVDYYFMEKIEGSNYHTVRGTLGETATENIDVQIGSYVRQMNEIIGDGIFGYEGNSNLQGSNWKQVFFLMMEASLLDGEKKGVELEFTQEEIWNLLHKFSFCLEEVGVPRLVHWDCWDGNVFVKDGQVMGIIDFERALWGDPLMECMFRYYNANLLKGYGKESFTQGEQMRCKLYDMYLGLVMVVECAYRCYDDESALQHGRRVLRETIEYLRKAELRDSEGLS